MPARFLAALAALLLWAAPAASRPSEGCGRAPPPSPPSSVEVMGRERAAIVAVPEGYDPGTPHRLVFAFHGRTDDAARVRRYYGLEAGAGGPAIFVYPQALRAADGRFAWSDPGDPPGALRDFALFDAWLARLAADYCVDLAQVHAVGHSLGATFANSLGCARGDVLAGVASLGGGIVARDPARTCRGRVAALVVHNPDDHLVPVGEGERARDAFLAQNGLAGAHPETAALPSHPPAYDCEATGGGTGAQVVWCEHGQDTGSGGRWYPHVWPQGAGRAAMAFLEALGEGATAAAD
ncbi:MAG TPA: hypothetical protein VEB20_11365 [Azospirillaceae bacterium]|nr:hypothetical protein [Azospirillaceae bacterium]